MRANTLQQLSEHHAASRAHSPALVDLDFPARGDYAQLHDRAGRLAAGFAARGVGAGDRVLWLGQNSGKVLEGILACAVLGAIFCPVNWRQSNRELEFVIDDLQPSLTLWQEEEIGDTLRQLRQFDARAANWVSCDGPDSGYEALLTDSAPPPPYPSEPDTPVLLLYTAAFDGHPNGALLSHRAVLAQSRNYSAVRKLDDSARYLNVGPLFHVATLLETMATFYCGGLNVFIRRAAPDAICRAIEQERCNGAFLLPATIDQVVDYAGQHAVDLHSLVALPGREEWNALVSVDDSDWGRTPYGYGQTETFGYASYSALAPGASGRMGKAAPGVDICMLDHSGAPLPPGETGEIAVRGDTVMNGYWRRDALNSARRAGDWHRCNDIGRIEADGSLSFIGPKAQMIRSGQENIYPAEVETCLREHEAVAEVAVIGVPDARWDQSVKALVVLAAGASCEAQALIDHCRERIASYKKPRHVEFVASLPRLGAGFDYAALNRDYGGGGYPGEAPDAAD